MLNTIETYEMIAITKLCFHCVADRQIEEDTLIRNDRQIVFTMEALIIATENFHENNKLGEGGFGAVYKVPYAKKASASL